MARDLALEQRWSFHLYGCESILSVRWGLQRMLQLSVGIDQVDQLFL